VGLEGSVTATDIDTRFLETLDLPKNVEVRPHDIAADPLEPDHHDLVHSRALIEHLPEPRRVLERMAAALRPGGWLVVEAADFITLRAAAPQHASSDVFDRVSRVFVDSMRADAIMDLRLAPRLPGLLGSLGLAQIDNEGVTRVYRGGSPLAIFVQQTLERVRERLLADDRLSERDLATFHRVLEDASFQWMAWIRFAAWGRRPSPAE
jgi:SAM-dependent methyltransferase